MPTNLPPALPLGAAATKLGLADGQEAEAALVDAVATGALGVLRVDDARRVARFDGAAPAFASEQQVAAELHAAVAAVLDVGATAAAMAERVALNPNFILKSDLVTAEAHVDRDDGHADVEGVTSTNACYGGTAALLACADFCLSCNC